MAKRFLLKDMIFKKKEATVIENMLVAMVSLIMVCAFLVIIFGAFAGISDKWSILLVDAMPETVVHFRY